MGNNPEVYTKNVTFYPSKKEEFNIHHDKIYVIINNSKIEIYSIDNSNQSQNKIYELEFNNEKILFHTYLCICKTLENKSRINTLYDLLRKTNVPVIKHPINIKTQAIIDKLLLELKGNTNLIDLINYDNKISALKAEIDFIIYQLFKLNKNDITILLNSLNTPINYRNKILSKY